jgi:adenylosuccinate synthase
MLLDVLSTFDELKIATAYNLHGQQTDWFPADAEELAQVEPVFMNLPGWHEDITGVREFSALPKAAQAYIEAIEKYVGVPVVAVSVGPERTQTLFR